MQVVPLEVVLLLLMVVVVSEGFVQGRALLPLLALAVVASVAQTAVVPLAVCIAVAAVALRFGCLPFPLATLLVVVVVGNTILGS